MASCPPHDRFLSSPKDGKITSWCWKCGMRRTYLDESLSADQQRYAKVLAKRLEKLEAKRLLAGEKP